MANIKKNEKTGKWEVRLSLGFNEEGKRVQRYFSDERKKTVEYWVADQVRAQKEGEFVKVRPKGRVGEVLDDWLEYYIKTTMAKTTYHSYTSFVDNVPGWFKRLNMDNVKPQHCLRLLREYLEAGLQPNTVNIRRSVYVGFFSWARRLDYYKGDNPMAAVEKLSEGLKEYKTLTPDELRRYLETADETMANGYRTAVHLIAYTGMRAREATSLRWSDIDFDRKQITIARTAIETKGGYSFEQTKGKKVRVVTIPDQLIRFLEKSRLRQKYDMVKFGWRNDEDLVCLGIKGAYVWYSGLRRRHNLTVKAAEVPEITMRELRHTHATLLIKAGVHAKVIQERLGHADAKTTMDIYAHVLHTTQGDTAELFSTMIEDVKKPL